MVIFPLAPDQTIAQMWSNGALGGVKRLTSRQYATHVLMAILETTIFDHLFI